MIVINKYGEEELYCDECGGEITDDEEVYDVDTENGAEVLCIFCLKKMFKRRDR